MKTLFCIFAVFLLSESCNSSKPIVQAEADQIQNPVSKISFNNTNNKAMTVTYQAISRLTFEYVQISDTILLYSTDRYLKAIEKYSLSDDERQVLTNLIETINIKQLPNLKAPTSKRLYDGAAITTLELTQNEDVYKTPAFDEGFPPMEIEVLVNKVLSIKENAIKQ